MSIEIPKVRILSHDEVVAVGVPAPDKNVPRDVRMGWLPPYNEVAIETQQENTEDN